MKKYQFPLARLERVREAQLAQARAELAAANAEVAAAERRRSAALEHLRSTSSLPGDVVDHQEFTGWLAGRRAAHHGLVAAGEVLDGAREVQQSALAGWQQCRQDHEVLVRLDDRRRELWQAEVRRDEANLLDEFATSRRPSDQA